MEYQRVTIHLKKMTGDEKLHNLTCKDDESITISELKHNYFTDDLDAGRIRFIYKGRVLDEDQVVGELELARPDTVIQVLITRDNEAQNLK